MITKRISENQIEYNKNLIKKYPFLARGIYDYDTKEYEFTWLDDLEPGWRIAFGKNLCEDLAEALKQDGCEDSFQFLQIKEKYAELRLYYMGGGDATRECLHKYEELSKYICGHCGKLATKITSGWYYPLCDDCSKEVHSTFTDIANFYSFNSYDDIIAEVEHIKSNYIFGDYWQPLK